GGWFGYLAFSGTRDAGVPAASLGWYPDVLRHDGRRWWHEALVGAGDDEDALLARRAALLTDLLRPTSLPPARLRLRGRPDPARHLAAVERCQQAIRRGDIYQANIATSLDLQLSGSPHDAWARLVERFDPEHAGLVAEPGCTAVGASPEQFLIRAGRTVRSRPIKGTRPRVGGRDDERERVLLGGSEKDAAENVMIVDLVRNDLARVCRTGSVTVPELLSVQPHPGVWHLVSSVAGELAAGHDDADLVRAAFPPGSVTGAPKIRAVEIIEEVEDAARGLFTGAMGYAGPLAGLELAVTIRTLEVAAGGRTRLGVGGGITVDSAPWREWRECLDKAAPILETLGCTDLRPRRAPRGAPRVDPAAGLRETLLLVDGRPVRLAEHVGRLQRSYWECYGETLHADIGAAVRAAASAPAGAPRHQVARITARPDDPGRVEVRVEPFAARRTGTGLVVHTLDAAGAHPHKWADRRWIDRIEAGLPPGVEALLVDDRGLLLETTRSNVFVVRGGVVRTPPLDGRLLPGVGRQAVLDRLDGAGVPYELAVLDLADLARADGAFVTNALRGPRWVPRVADVAVWGDPHPALREVLRLVAAEPAGAADVAGAVVGAAVGTVGPA
ncbi:MAG: chorismate-binding protein, partial [Pseudonocardia sp.]